MAARFVPCLPFYPFPRRRKILDAGNHSVQQMRLQLPPYSSCLFYFVDMKDHQLVQSAVRSSRTVVCFYPVHGTFLPASLVAGMTRRIFSGTMAWVQKSLLLHLTIAQIPPVLSHCQSI